MSSTSRSKGKKVLRAPAGRRPTKKIPIKGGVVKTSSHGSTKKYSKNQLVKVVIDCHIPANDTILEVTALEKFFNDKIKATPAAKSGKLTDQVKVRRKGNTHVVITAVPPFSKKYIKYLTKRFLKKQQLRDWLRLVATKPHIYQLRYFNIHDDDDDDDSEAGSDEDEDMETAE
mmetsp:Transcript_13275/g.14714  ORF Transcript_13275/g.14714 Transcript_13275/m.14714 type:complete len:173 (+) Transcript_13275:50-568(+)